MKIQSEYIWETGSDSKTYPTSLTTDPDYRADYN